MKKIASILLVLISMLSFAGCQKTMYDEADFIEQARKEYNIANAETAVITYVGESIEGNKSLLWFVSGNEYQGHTYLPMSCSITEDGGRVFEHAYSPLKRGTDIYVLPEWCGGYGFCVNNPKCKTIKIDDYSGVKEIEVTEYPFIYYNDLLPSEYFFLDENGEELN